MAARTVLCALALGIAACAGTGPHSGAAGSAYPTAKVPLPAATQASVDTTNPNLTADGKVTTGKNYVIGPEDLLKIEVYGAETMNRSVRVNAAGQIVLPLIGVVQAAGLTSEQLAGEIAARLGKDYMQNPQVIIFIEEYTSQRVTVVGAVATPGVYPLKGRATLVQAVASAGGPSKVANIRLVKLMRLKPDGTRNITEYNLNDIQEGRISDPEIRGEDLVLVDTSLYKDTVTQMIQWLFPLAVFGTVL
ncbi:polysaccharide biosynthesis/export family protein [uncultured Thiodictyon sp.]|uniref:polysaccharide biosynthesis/export family protein n=1 Tax=uncultured Thiodictyon sp. TaxID=1846217 RepID=UPI0025EF96FC|nr:polysaccharide biosynthesis/export family protein [uncultured Thiodictyon sp.]